MSSAGSQINPIFHLQKSLEFFNKNSADKIWSKKDKEIKVSPLMQIRVKLLHFSLVNDAKTQSMGDSLDFFEQFVVHISDICMKNIFPKICTLNILQKKKSYLCLKIHNPNNSSVPLSLLHFRNVRFLISQNWGAA
jgi:hypothetical protein